MVATTIVMFLVVAIHPLYGQTTNATLSGTVTDPSGAVVQGVKVTVINLGTSSHRQATTNAEGRYVVPMLPPGEYKIRAEKKGFAGVEVPKLVLNVSDQRELNIKVKVGGAAETVTVTADSTAGVETSAAIGTTVDRRFLANTPLNGRSFQSLLLMTPGVVMGDGDAAPVLAYGSFIQAIINFLLVALCIFLFVKLVAKFRKPAPAAPAKPAKLCPYCFGEVNDKATRCPHCTSELKK
jgi:hypothetical protein